jgi:hypothetical protein
MPGFHDRYGWPRSLRRTATIGALVIALLCTCNLHRSAQAAPITLGSAADYGLLVGSGQTLDLNGGVVIAGNVGIGANSSVQLSGINVVSGTAYEDSGVSTRYGFGLTFVTGGTVTASMANTVDSALAASNAAASLGATAGLTNQNGAISLNGQSLTIKAMTNLSENVLYISSLSLLNSTLTFDDNGYTNAKFIIDITGGFSVNSTGSLKSVIQGINGASADDIIFNIEGTGTAVNLTGNSASSVIGTILAPSRSVTLGGGGSLTGAIVAGVNNAGKSYTVSSSSGGYDIASLGYTPRPSSTSTPEPASIFLFGTGAFMLLSLRRKIRL